MRSYLDVTIRFRMLDGSTAAAAVTSPGGEAEERVALPAAYDGADALAAHLQRHDANPALLATLGADLFAGLFHGSIKDVYARTQGMLAEGQHMRLRLLIPPEAHALARLPWELLHDPERGALALLDTPITRAIPQAAALPAVRAPLPLHVLLSAAQTPPAVDVARALDTAARALGPHVRLTVEPHLTYAALQQHLRAGFHVWHFVGHGGMRPDGAAGRLFFEEPAPPRPARRPTPTRSTRPSSGCC